MSILLAEDCPDNQRLVEHILTRAGAKVQTVSNGRAAVELASASPQSFDLILLDMQMPEMDGYTTARSMRRAGICTPIIALTALAMVGDREKCLAAGCDDYAIKPVQPDVLLALLALRRRLAA